ncbi:MAG: iron-siderophore ABC transporter substrate-binding protein [Pseudonocardia sp.]|nr:iron-siderophore ABC transporter substrate-binding protein [Pseudonocardia sp.]
MRRSTLVVVVVMLSLGLAACGRSGESLAKNTGEASGAFPVTVEHEYGTTTVAAATQRVVSLGFKDQDWLYAFGVSPVAVRKWYGLFPNEINPWAESHVVGQPPAVLEEIDYEKIAALRPDLIVSVYSGITGQEYQELSRIAPTVAGPVGSTDYNEPWRDVTRLIGTALGQPQRAETMITEIDGLFAKAKQRHPGLVSAEVSTAYAWSPDSIGVYTSGDPRPKFLAELGIQTPQAVDKLAGVDTFHASISPELVADTFDLADDAVVVIGSPNADEPGAHTALQNTTFSSSRVANQGRVVFLDTTLSDVAFSFASPLSIPFTLEHLVPRLAAAIDGDPATAVPAAPGTFEAGK